jgi:hypothetical protein
MKRDKISSRKQRIASELEDAILNHDKNYPGAAEIIKREEGAFAMQSLLVNMRQTVYSHLYALPDIDQKQESSFIEYYVTCPFDLEKIEQGVQALENKRFEEYYASVLPEQLGCMNIYRNIFERLAMIKGFNSSSHYQSTKEFVTGCFYNDTLWSNSDKLNRLVEAMSELHFNSTSDLLHSLWFNFYNLLQEHSHSYASHDLNFIVQEAEYYHGMSFLRSDNPDLEQFYSSMRILDSQFGIKKEILDEMSNSLLGQEVKNIIVLELDKYSHDTLPKLLNMVKFCAVQKYSDLIKLLEIDIAGYTLLKRLGEGDEGITYQAIHPVHGEIKVKLFKHLSAYGVAERKTLDEQKQRVSNRIDVFHKHVRNMENIANLYDVGICKVNNQERLFITSDYVEAGSLEYKDDKGYNIREGISRKNAYHIALVHIAGLHPIHKAGKILREVKLNNLLVSEDLNTILVDDLESIVDLRDVRSGFRHTKGSNRYIAPEVYVDSANASVNSDLYCVAVGLLYMITKKPTLLNDINRIEKPEYEDELNNILESEDLRPYEKVFFAKALAYDPKDRYQNHRDMSMAIGLLSGFEDYCPIFIGKLSGPLYHTMSSFMVRRKDLAFHLDEKAHVEYKK